MVRCRTVTTENYIFNSRQPGQCLPPLLLIGGEESLKGETPGRQTRHRQSAHGGAAAGGTGSPPAPPG